MVSNAIQKAQKRVEARNFDIRKYVLEYDDVMNQQRKVVYEQRRRILEGENMKDQILNMVDTIIEKEWKFTLIPNYIRKNGILPAF